MRGGERKAAVTAYKERKTEAGIYVVRCASSGQVWAGAAPDVSTIRNRLWFTLRQRCNVHRSLQDAWDGHGAEAFVFEVVERLEEEALAYVRNRLLKQRLADWVDRLGAIRI